MTAQDLKNSILQLAVQGKLVSQDSSDESAVELYKKITGSSNGMIIGDTDYNLPSNWCLTKLKNLIKLTSGQDLKPNQYSDVAGETPYITGASNIKNENVIINRWTNQPRSIARKGDLLISCKGTIGAMAYLDVDNAHIARQIMAVSISPLLCKDYVKFFIQTSISKLQRAAKSMIPGISRNDILELLFPLPPVAEQKRIVAKIEELLPLINEYNEAEKRLTSLNAEFPDKLRKSILQQAVEGKLTERDPSDEPASELIKYIRTERSVLQKNKMAKKSQAAESIAVDEIPFDIPETWEWVNLGWICQKVGAGSTPKGGSAVYIPEGIKFLREQNVHDDGLHLDGVVYIDEETHSAKAGSQVQPQDILMNITGGSIGRNALVPDDFDTANVNQHILIIRLVDKELRHYLHYCFSSPTVLNQMFTKQAGDKPGLSATKVENFLIPIPPLAEQKRIVARVEELLAVCDGVK